MGGLGSWELGELAQTTVLTKTLLCGSFHLGATSPGSCSPGLMDCSLARSLLTLRLPSFRLFQPLRIKRYRSAREHLRGRRRRRQPHSRLGSPALRVFCLQDLKRGETCSQQLQRLVPQGRPKMFVLSFAEESSPCKTASPFFHLTLFWGLAGLLH